MKTVPFISSGCVFADPPSAPGVTIVTESRTTITIRVTPSGDSGGYPLVNYTLFWRKSDAHIPYTELAVKGVLSDQILSQLDSGETYEMFVHARNGAGSANSEVLKAETKQACT